MNMVENTVFVLVTDDGYLFRAKKTIQDLRSRGMWLGDIVVINIGSLPLQSNFKDFYRLKEKRFPPIEEKFQLLHKLNFSPFLDTIDGREISKINQWEKLHVMDSYFQKWERVVFLDSGLRVLDDVYSTVLQLDYKGKFLAPDDGGNYVTLPNPTKLFHTQVSEASPSRIDKLKKDFPVLEDLDQPYFLNCMWVYDTSILSICSKDEMISGILEYPICLTNEMTLMNLYLHYKYNLWERFPVYIERHDHLESNSHDSSDSSEKSNNDGTVKKILFEWCEANNPQPSSWRDYCFIKYPCTLSFDDT